MPPRRERVRTAPPPGSRTCASRRSRDGCTARRSPLYSMRTERPRAAPCSSERRRASRTTRRTRFLEPEAPRPLRRRTLSALSLGAPDTPTRTRSAQRPAPSSHPFPSACSGPPSRICEPGDSPTKRPNRSRNREPAHVRPRKRCAFARRAFSAFSPHRRRRRPARGWRGAARARARPRLQPLGRAAILSHGEEVPPSWD
jgi:hypothetical protein